MFRNKKSIENQKLCAIFLFHIVLQLRDHRKPRQPVDCDVERGGSVPCIVGSKDGTPEVESEGNP